MDFRNCDRPKITIEFGVNGKPLLPQVSPGWLFAKYVNAAIGEVIFTIILLFSIAFFAF